ncbi:UV-stimulated scaffold protein A homolog [Malania oleifera]|uniref:UV-stimulated scaffold protein A homolog n=1 Tax=Malania oleifera TaxID=397392 RepID=UPI0025ADA528|nr:UV-stimulated scaffold protein A homolog [Malania oleifera]
MMEEEEGREGGGGGKVCALIEKATNSSAPEVDPRLLKSIKSLVRYSDSELRLAAQTLMSLMKRDHSQVRYLALLIIDELFMRSKLFRTLLVVNLDQLLSLSVGFRRNLPLPAPPAVASVLRSKAIEFLEKWNASFGIHYRQLRLGFDYLKNTLRFQFPNLQANSARIQQQRREREMRSKEILLSKFETLKGNISSIKDEIQSTIGEIAECLDIVHAKDEVIPLAPIDDEEIEEFRSSELRQIRLDSLKEGEKVHENSDNKVVFDALREQYKLLVTRHLVSVQEWISVLVRVEIADKRFRDSTLKEFIDIRNHIQSVKKKCEESGCVLPNAINNEEEDIWEEGKIEPFKNGSSTVPSKQIEDLPMVRMSNEVQNGTPEHGNKVPNGNEMLDRECCGSDSNSLRGKLLAEAPVMKWGSFLDNWGLNRDILANQRGLELEGHWGRVDNDAVIPAEKIAELNVQTTLYKEEHVEIQPCRAPLGKGRLCQRRDLRVCPFHGPIIPRDDEGKPIYESSSTDIIDLDVGNNLVNKLAKQAVMNVRDRDKEAAKKREYDKQSLKRAKLAKVREHNDAVLREAALASTSRSAVVVEDLEAMKAEKSSNRKEKQTLASMLRKKVTRKDRLGQRLLNTRARDSTRRQLTLGEDSKYREAFPNQW